MIAYSLSHWGITLIPDDYNRINVQFNKDGSIEKFDDLMPMMIQTIVPPYLVHVPHRTITEK